MCCKIPVDIKPEFAFFHIPDSYGFIRAKYKELNKILNKYFG